MIKTKTAFFCKECGASHAKWMGKCTSCGEWNSIIEEVIEKKTGELPLGNVQKSRVPKKITEISTDKISRIHTADTEFDRVLGGGIVPGSIVLIGGEPGIGKSTLLLQTALTLPQTKVLYVSGEESENQLVQRAQRIGNNHENLYVLGETNTHKILHAAQQLKPEVIVIDSIQTLHSPNIDSTPGSISQIRECAAELMRYAKNSNVPIFIVGHITKDGMLAGPKLLEHMVDAVLHFEGDRNYHYRILRTIKNRFGAAAELGVYEMKTEGLIPVTNPTHLFVGQNEDVLSGTSIGIMMEGLRPLLIEVQALVSPAFYGTPQRSATGFDAKRLNMLLAVLEKRAGYAIGTKDVFLNIAGGLKVGDPALDLAVAAALISSFEDIPIPRKIAFSGEISLSGEVRAVQHIEQRIREAQKLGYTKVLCPASNVKDNKILGNDKKLLPIAKINALSEYVRSIDV